MNYKSTRFLNPLNRYGKLNNDKKESIKILNKKSNNNLNRTVIYNNNKNTLNNEKNINLNIKSSKNILSNCKSNKNLNKFINAGNVANQSEKNKEQNEIKKNNKKNLIPFNKKENINKRKGSMK